MKITLNTILGELLEEYPQAEEVIRKHMGQEVYCLGCPGRMFDTIENGAMLHGLNEKQILQMIVELQQVVDQDSKKDTVKKD